MSFQSIGLAVTVVYPGSCNTHTHTLSLSLSGLGDGNDTTRTRTAVLFVSMSLLLLITSHFTLVLLAIIGFAPRNVNVQIIGSRTTDTFRTTIQPLAAEGGGSNANQLVSEESSDDHTHSVMFVNSTEHVNVYIVGSNEACLSSTLKFLSNSKRTP
jgi:hypothetical protein